MATKSPLLRGFLGAVIGGAVLAAFACGDDPTQPRVSVPHAAPAPGSYKGWAGIRRAFATPSALTMLLLAQLMAGETPRFDPEPFRADRY